MDRDNAITYIRQNFTNINTYKKQTILNYIYNSRPNIVIIKDKTTKVDIKNLTDNELNEIIKIISTN